MKLLILTNSPQNDACLTGSPQECPCLGCESALDKQHGALRISQKFDHETCGHPVLAIRARAVDTELCLLAKIIYSVNEVEVPSVLLSNLVSALHDVSIRQESLVIDAHGISSWQNHVSVAPGSEFLMHLPIPGKVASPVLKHVRPICFG
jgi:hypothetical protein